MINRFLTISLICFGVLLSSCSDAKNNINDPILKAIANKERPAADVERDVNRKPAEVLKFFGAKPDMTILDIFSGGGYYTEILNDLVGADGKVIAQNNQSYLNFEKETITARYLDNRLKNTEQYISEANEINLPAQSVDLAILVLGFHDIYYKPEDNSWPTIDLDLFFNAVIASIKEGGVLGVVDHRAVAGAPVTTGNDIHRIDPDVVIMELTSRGLVLEAQSDILANPEDDLTKPMWEPSVKGKTDRFVMRFRKPKSDESAMMSGVDYKMALNANSRTEEEKARDEDRKPDEVLAFYGVKAGMSVVDLASGGGYYTKILSSVVGDDGMVLAQTGVNTSPERMATMKAALEPLGNVTYVAADMAKLPLDDQSVDRVFLFLLYHHMHYGTDGSVQLPAATVATLAEIKRVLKPDGVFGVIEHIAQEGTSREQSAGWHRVPNQTAIDDLAANGFKLVKQSDILLGHDDPMDCAWSTCQERGKTNRFVHYYQPK